MYTKDIDEYESLEISKCFNLINSDNGPLIYYVKLMLILFRVAGGTIRKIIFIILEMNELF